MSNARALYPKHQIWRRARGNGSALELLVAALVVVTSTAIYSLSRSGRGGVSDQKWPHTISLCVDRHQVAAERLQPGMRSAATRSGPPTFFAWGCSSLPTAPRPCQRPVHPAPALKTLFATSPARPGAAEMHKRQDARKVGRGHGSKFRPCSG